MNRPSLAPQVSVAANSMVAVGPVGCWSVEVEEEEVGQKLHVEDRVLTSPLHRRCCPRRSFQSNSAVSASSLRQSLLLVQSTPLPGL